MPKAKLTINIADVKKAKVASEFSGVVISPDYKQIGGDVYLNLSSPSCSNYIQFGKLLSSVTGNELDGMEKKEAKPKAEKA